MGLIQKLRSALRTRAAIDPALAYLNESTSTVDLELRQREVDRGRFRNLPRQG